MDKCRVNIVCLEPSDLVFEGLSNILLKANSHYYLIRIKELEELSKPSSNFNPHLVIINPASVQNRQEEFSRLIRNQFPSTRWIGLVYALFDTGTLELFDDLLHITDPVDIIQHKINQGVEDCGNERSETDTLSNREKDVLKLLTKGLSNKEMAEELNISIHTVISHRKNIVEKTGIRSLPGLTIYAITQKITHINE